MTAEIPISIVAAVAFGLTALYVALRRRHKPTWKPIVILLLACAELTSARVLQGISSDLATKVFWYKTVYLGFTITPTAFLFIALSYSRLGYVLTSRTWFLLSVIPALTVGLVFTNEIHGWMWNPANIVSIVNSLDFLTVADARFGYWVHVGYSYFVIVLGCFFLVRFLIRSRGIHGWQATAVILAAVLAMLGSALDVFKVSPLPPFSVAALGLAVGGFLMVYKSSALRRRDLVSISRPAILDSISDGVIVVDGDGQIADMNPAAQKLVGRPASQAIAKPLEQFLPGVISIWSGNTNPHGEVALDDGNALRVFDLRVSAIRGWRDHVEGQVVVLRDITERKRMEEGLRGSEERYRTLVETVPDVIFSLSAEGILTSLNPAFEKITGWSRAEWIGKSFHTILHPDDLAHAADHFSSALSGKMSPIFEASVLCKSGHYITGEFIGAPHIKDGKVIEVIGFARDITDRKKAEEALKKKTEELARSNRELEAFAYVASHDLQEPLRMVTNFVQLLAKRYKGNLDSNADDFIHFAVDGAMRMWNLINDLLAYSRVGTRGHPFEPIHCETILEGVLRNLKVTMEESGAVVTHDSLPTVMADRSQLGQLFQNLIGNAIKFRGNERPRIHVSANRNGNGWTFSVRDNGIGIAPEYTERIFIIFQRLHGREQYPGTGIGLAICKKIVERHGGRIWVESTPEKGATFYFTLPNEGVQQTQPSEQ
ncbi:MAG TPA: histidine kinase N-terminal 7TM domain-containing protein [Thermodesulfobacteriota bacterium]|nr:histidine kinase N-terminal 7TM domain-containing protein [Thermodesulfobacteriota bacterium]